MFACAHSPIFACSEWRASKPSDSASTVDGKRATDLHDFDSVSNPVMISVCFAVGSFVSSLGTLAQDVLSTTIRRASAFWHAAPSLAQVSAFAASDSPPLAAVAWSPKRSRLTPRSKR